MFSLSITTDDARPSMSYSTDYTYFSFDLCASIISFIFLRMSYSYYLLFSMFLIYGTYR